MTVRGNETRAGTVANRPRARTRAWMPEWEGTRMSEKFSVNGSTSYNDGSVVSKTLINHGAGTVTLFAFDKDQALSEHTAPYDALVNVTDGEAEVSIAGRPQILRAGESVLMPANVPHALRAVERFKMMLVMIKGN